MNTLQRGLTRISRPPGRLGAGWANDPEAAKLAGLSVLALAAVATAVLSAGAASFPRSNSRSSARALLAKRSRASTPARRLHASAALLSASVLTDSAVEHYRGAFENPGMYTPLLVSGAALLAGADGATGGRAPRWVRDGAYALAGATGAVGFGFHVYNVLRKPGGFSWHNLFYAAPVGAPAALSLAGVIGLAADEVGTGRSARVVGAPMGRVLSALTSAGLLGTVSEVALLHFRGAFQNPFMWLPVSLPPVAAVLMGKAAFEPSGPKTRPLTRAWLAITATLGGAGVGFHAYGVSRAMGGWRNWSQNLIDGPPLPAPPSFSALALAALAALSLRDQEDAR